MKTANISKYEYIRATLKLYLGILLLGVATLGVLHYYFADLKAGGIRWFNLDSERNISTWYSGVLFFLFGCSAFVAYYWEQQRNSQGPLYFRLPILWLGVGLAGLFMSLDEITILHENLFWQEIRQASAQLDNTWKYLTQWQILYAPAIILVFGFMAVFFYNRFSASRSARRGAFMGIGCLLTAIFLEGVRGWFKLKGDNCYNLEALVEEILEMNGAIFLLAAIVFYTVDIALDFTPQRLEHLGTASRILTKHELWRLSGIFLVLIILGSIIYLVARKQAITGAPVPRLFKKALPPQTGLANKPSTIEVSSPDIWFDDLSHTTGVASLGMDTLLRSIRAYLSGSGTILKNIPTQVKKDILPRVIFLSVSGGNTGAKIAMGSGMGIQKALEKALGKLRPLLRESGADLRIKVDIVKNVHLLENVNFDQVLLPDRSLSGIAFERSSALAFLPEELVAHTLVNGRQKIRFKNITKYLKSQSTNPAAIEDIIRNDNSILYRFTTDSYYLDEKGFSPLYRGHRLFNDLTPEILLSAARQAGNYLINRVGSDGKFVYSYRPKTDEISEKYNILRHAGTVYSMLELFEITKEEKLLMASKKAIDYLLQSAKPFKTGNDKALCIVENGYIKLGGNALAIIALARFTVITGDRQYLPKLVDLGKYIQYVQKENGEFYIHKQSYPEGERAPFVSEYYPGEALLALTRLYRLDARSSWLETAEKGAQYLINVRDKDLPLARLIHDHWFLYALNELYRYRPKTEYLNQASKIARAIVESQNRNPQYRDWLGSYYRPPRSTPTATRTEGLCAAYLLTRDFGDTLFAEKILDSIHMAVKFQLQTQFRGESVMYLRKPNLALGGFHRSLTNFEIRIDYVQHNISALLGLYGIEGVQD